MKERLTVTEVRGEVEVTAFGDRARRYAVVAVVAEGAGRVRRIEWQTAMDAAPGVGQEVEVEVTVRAAVPA